MPTCKGQMPDEVRILVVGEDGVGKSSLIMSLISEEFNDHVPAKLDHVLIPADVSSEHVASLIVDFSKKTQSEEELLEELKQASVICIVYAVDLPDTIEKVTTYWLPMIQTTLGSDHGIPVILVGNRADFSTNHMDNLLPIMNKWAEIETCVECSAKTMKNINELFYYAQKAVLHPTQPLYVPEDKELTAKCKKALVRIFKICDNDNDGLLNDYEMNQFQLICFGVPLTVDAVQVGLIRLKLDSFLQDVKAVVQKSVSDGVMENALTLSGFLFLHTLFIQRGRHETTWTVLRKFGYDMNLQLSPEYLYPPIKVPRGCSTEFTQEGFQFLTALFQKFDEDKDGCLSGSELQNLFSICPTQPWNQDALNCVETNEHGWLTYHGYICYWILSTFLDVSRTLELLAYLGFNVRHGSQQAAIRVTRDRHVDIQEKKTDRTVFQCHVIGPKEAGKTSFIQSLVGRNLKQVADLNRRQLSPFVMNSVLVQNQKKYLLLHEVDVHSPGDMLSQYEKSADVVCLLYDASNSASFEYCANIFLRYFYRTRVPCLIVQTKSERFEVEQNYEQQPVDFCRSNQLPKPLKFLTENCGKADEPIFSQLAMMAVYPHLKKVWFIHESTIWPTLTLSVAAVALVGFLVYKNL